MSFSSASSIIRRVGIQRRSFVRSFAAAAAAAAAAASAGRIGKAQPPSDRNHRVFAGVVVGFLAAGVSSVGFLLLPSPSPESLVSLADSEASDLDHSRAFLNAVEEKKSKPQFLLGDSYRRRVFFNYEKRIRLLSPPEKIFEYFASFRTPEGEILMLPTDLMRAVVPVFPPSESTIIREGHLRGERSPGELHCAPSTFFMLFDVNNDGLISFPEYIFFVTLLSIPESSFSVAFKMFDLDNDGEIKKDEFKKVMTLMRSHNRQGACHRNGLRLGLKVGRCVETGGLVEYFFGKDGNESLQHDKFTQFLRDLHDEIVRLEFAHYDFNSKGTISSKDFALSLVASADINHINKFLDRVDELDQDPHLKSMRISYEEFKAFAELRRSLKALALAIFSYGEVNGLLTKHDFQRAASKVCGVSISEDVIDVIFHIFDANRDGNLSSEEFLSALQRRESDIGQPTTTGVMGLLSCLFKCTEAYSFGHIALQS